MCTLLDSLSLYIPDDHINIMRPPQVIFFRNIKLNQLCEYVKQGSYQWSCDPHCVEHVSS